MTDNSERDELADLIEANHTTLQLDPKSGYSRIKFTTTEDLAAAIWAAGYRKPPATESCTRSTERMGEQIYNLLTERLNPSHSVTAGIAVSKLTDEIISLIDFHSRPYKVESGPYDPLWRLYSKDRVWM